MAELSPYLHFAGTAREALDFYHGVFGGELRMFTNGDMGRTDGDAAAIGHGILSGPVSLFAADVDGTQPPFAASGLMFALLGTAQSEVLRGWFAGLSAGGRVVEALEQRPWGDTDGQVLDKYGVLWLIGFEPGT